MALFLLYQNNRTGYSAMPSNLSCLGYGEKGESMIKKIKKCYLFINNINKLEAAEEEGSVGVPPKCLRLRISFASLIREGAGLALEQQLETPTPKVRKRKWCISV